MKTSKIIQRNVLYLLKKNNRWMTANELINCGTLDDVVLMTKDTPYKGHSHPVFRILTAMTNDDEHKVYTPNVMRRVRTSGPEKGNYEYALTGMGAYIRRYVEAVKNI